MYVNHLTVKLLSAFFAIFIACSAFAGPGVTTYQAKIIKPDGLPLEANSVNFKFTILNPVGNCILYSETYSSINMTSTGGLIAFPLGSGVKVYPVSATTFAEVFSNVTPNLSCDAGGPGTYTPGASDTRKVVMQFHDGGGWQTLPAMSINAVPYAMYANEAQKISGLPTCNPGEALSYNGVTFSCEVISGGGAVTSSTVTAALGYTPASSATVDSLVSSVASDSANLSSVSATVYSVSTTVTSLQNSVAASFTAMASSQWASLNGLTSVSQTIAFGTTGVAPNVSSVGSVHTFNFPFASVGTTTAGVISNSDYAIFMNKLEATGSAIISALGYTPANAVSVTTLSSDVATVSAAVSSLAASTAASFSAITNSQWLTSGTTISYSTGDVGIGTSAPTATLDVISSVGSMNLTRSIANATGPDIYLQKDRVASAVILGDNLGHLSFKGFTGASYTRGARISSVVTSAPAVAGQIGADLRFFTNDSGADAIERMRIMANGNVGIGAPSPVTKLEVSGGLRISMESATCSVSFAGTLRYNSGLVEYCNGTTWSAFGVAGAGITLLNGSSSATQIFATGITGTNFNISSMNGTHTFNIPLAATASVTAGLLSNADYLTFTNKVSSTSASIIAALGYEPALNSASGTYAQKANNLSDLTSAASARTNLGLGGFATVSSLDLGSASATGILAEARLPSFANITSGAQYTKVTVDGKGRVTSGAQLTSSDVTTALGYSPASASASSQWTTSGTSVFYNTGNVGIGVSNPSSLLTLANSGVTTTFRMSGNVSNSVSTRFQMANDVNHLAQLAHIGSTAANANLIGIANTVNLATSGDAIILAAYNASGTIRFGTGGFSNSNERMRIDQNGNVGIGTIAPTAVLQIKAGTSLTAQLKLDPSVLLTAPQSGAVEYDGTNLYFTDSTNARRTIAATSAAGSYDNVSLISNLTGDITVYPNTGAGSLIVSATTASTNAQTGALVVKGGVGVSGDLYTSGTITSSSTIQGVSVVATAGILSPAIYGSTLASGSLTIDSTSNISKGKVIIAPSGGFVGVGTANPTSVFEVQGGVAAIPTPIILAGQSSNAGNTAGGAVMITAGNANASTTRALGGGIYITAGMGAGAGTPIAAMRGGPITMTAGQGASAGAPGGTISLIGGAGGSVSGNGGTASLRGGSATSGIAGTANVAGGFSAEGMGGSANINGGAGGSATGASYAGGTVNIIGGIAANTASGGTVNIVGGNSTLAQAGTVNINGGSGVGSVYSDVLIQTGTGKVGIGGYASGNYKVDVTGDVQANSGFYTDAIATATAGGNYGSSGFTAKSSLWNGSTAESPAWSFYTSPQGGTNASNDAYISSSGSSNFLNSSLAVVGPANAGSSVNSPIFKIGGYYYTGSNVTKGYWQMQTQYGAGANPTSTFVISASGSPGISNMALMTGNFGIGTTSPTAALHIKAGTTSLAPLKFTSGALLTSPQSGTIEYDGTALYFTDGTNTRRAIASTGAPGLYDAVNTVANSSGNIALYPNTGAGSVIVSATTASTNSTTGALIVKGGLGVTGNIYSSGTIITSSNIQGASITATNGMITPYVYGSIVSGGSLRLDSTTHASKGNILLAPNGGKVGIGLINPIDKLHIYDGDIRLGSSTDTNSSQGMLKFGSAGYPNGYAGIAGIAKGSPDRMELAFSTAYGPAVEAMRISEYGSVGIGTSSPLSILTVTGARQSATIKNTISTFDTQAFNVDVGAGIGFGGKINASGTMAHFGLFGARKENNTVDNTAGYLVFETRPAGGNLSEKMRINSLGNVGLGTATPGVLLDLYAAASPTLRIRSASNDPASGPTIRLVEDLSENGGLIRYNALTNNLDLGVSESGVDNTRISINRTTGNVGIGTTSPPLDVVHIVGTSSTGLRIDGEVSQKLNIIGNIEVHPILTLPSARIIGPANRSVTMEINGNGPTDRFSVVTDLSNAGSASSEAFVVTNAGNVGIGTSAPTVAMHIQKGDANGAGLFLQKDSLSAGLTLGTHTTSGKGYVQGANFNNTAIADLLINPFGGNVGIGTSAPATYLDIAGNGGETLVLRDKDTLFTDNAFALYIRGKDSANNNVWYVGEGSSGAKNVSMMAYQAGYPLTFGTSSTERMRVDDFGNVGIGTTAPNTLLQVGPTGPASIGYSTFVGSYLSTSGQAQYIGNWASTGYWGIGPATNANDNTLRIGRIDTASATWNATQVTSLLIGGNIGIGGQINVTGNVQITSGSALRIGAANICTSAGCVSSSDLRLKENIQPLDFSLEKLLSLKGVQYDWKNKAVYGDQHQIGFIAQELEKVFPEVVYTDKETGLKTVSYGQLLAPVVEAIKVLFGKTKDNTRAIASLEEKDTAKDKQIKALTLENERKDKELREMKERLDRIEKALAR